MGDGFFISTRTDTFDQRSRKINLCKGNIISAWREVRPGKIQTWANIIDFDNPPVGIKENDTANVSAEFNLSQNYPNPFNPTTTISYALPFESRVTLEIYDITGRLIQKYESQNEQAGYHNFVWNGKNNNSFDAASGVYIYRFIAASLENKEVFSKSDKMMLVR